MDAWDRLLQQGHARLASWRAREELAGTPRYRAAERRALRWAISRAAVPVAALLVGGAVASTLVDPLVGWELLALNGAAAALSLALAWLVQGRARRHVAGIAYLWGMLMAATLLAAGLTTPFQMRIAATIMPAIPLVYALFMPWTTPAHLIAVAWTTVAALLLSLALRGTGVDPVSPIALTAIAMGAISVVGHAHRRADRIDAFRQLMQIRALHRQAREAGRQLRATNRELASSALLDPLTGAGNRRSLEADLATLDASGDAIPGGIALVLVDVDRFKAYNDRHGHLAGDWVLRRVADCLAESVRAADRVYRYGGEELLVLLAGVEVPAAEAVVGRLLAGVQALDIPHPENRPWQVVTISAGWAPWKPGSPTSWAAALGAADDALYRAKRLGRNRAVAADRAETRTATA